jgi:hypothetical protein
MRTTLNIDDDVLEIARTYAAERNLSMGAAISHFIRRAAAAQLQTPRVETLHVHTSGDHR